MTQPTQIVPRVKEEEKTLTQISQVYLHAATSQNTRKAYQQDIRHFIAAGNLLPTTPTAIIHYLHMQANQLNPRTLARRLTAIRQWHVSQGFNDPTQHLLVRKTLTGIKNIHGRPKEKALALRIEELITISRYLQRSERLVDVRNNALLQVGYFGAFRRSEIVALHYHHLLFMPEGVEVLIPRSKADQSGEGQVCALPNGNADLCPVRALKAWLQRSGIKSGPVFPRMSKNDKITTVAITGHQVNEIVKQVAHACHLENADRYSSHSLRRGFATSASREGATLSAIMQQGRWKHTETALGYMEEGQRFATNAAGLILNKRST